jgi:transcriptional regulator with XRE-family HTH domain
MSATRIEGFGARLREYRKRAGRTLQEVADRCGCERREIAAIERLERLGAVDLRLIRRILVVVKGPGVDVLSAGYTRTPLPDGRMLLSIPKEPLVDGAAPSMRSR